MTEGIEGGAEGAGAAATASKGVIADARRPKCAAALVAGTRRRGVPPNWGEPIAPSPDEGRAPGVTTSATKSGLGVTSAEGLPGDEAGEGEEPPPSPPEGRETAETNDASEGRLEGSSGRGEGVLRGRERRCSRH